MDKLLGLKNTIGITWMSERIFSKLCPWCNISLFKNHNNLGDN